MKNDEVTLTVIMPLCFRLNFFLLFDQKKKYVDATNKYTTYVNF